MNQGFYAEISRGLPDNATILLNYFSREDEEVLALFERDSERVLKCSGGKNLNVVLALRDSFSEQLKSAGALFLQGGETSKLLEALKAYPDFANAVKGKVIAGSSAGAQVLAKYYHSSTYGGILEGLGVLPIRLIPHYQSHGFKKKDDPVALMEEYPHNLELVILKDYEWRVFHC